MAPLPVNHSGSTLQHHDSSFFWHGRLNHLGAISTLISIVVISSLISTFTNRSSPFQKINHTTSSHNQYTHEKHLLSKTMSQPSPSKLAAVQNYQVTTHNPPSQLQKAIASFPTLPVELRVCIWKLVFSETSTPRVVEIFYDSRVGMWLSPRESQAPLPALTASHINREARQKFWNNWSVLVPLSPADWPMEEYELKGDELEGTREFAKSFPTSYFNPRIENL